MKNLEAMAKEMMGIEMNKLLSIILLIFISCNEAQETSSETEVEVSKSNVEAWVGTFTGVSPSYNLTTECDGGEFFVINSNYINIESHNYTFEIYDNNTCSIYYGSKDDNYACHNIRYSVSSNNNNFSLTMHPVSGSDCGGCNIILFKKDNLYSIAEGGFGRPYFVVKKNN